MSKTVLQSASVVWDGTIARGSGRVTGASGATGELPVDLPNRLGEAVGKTSPEELLAAAHATCFTTTLGSILAARKTPPERLEVRATVTLDLSGERAQIPTIAIEATIHAPCDAEALDEILSEAEGRCLISRILTSSVAITVSGRLA